MKFPFRFPRYVAPVLIAGLPFLGCMGRVDPNVGEGAPPPSGGGSSSGSGSSGGTPSGSSSGGSGSSSGISSSSSGGGSGSSGGFSSSSSSGGSGSSSGISSSSSSGGSGDPDCSLLGVPNLARVCPDGTSVGGQYVLSNHQCVLEFPCPPHPPPGGSCTQGALCSPGSGCGSVSTNPSACSTSCKCDGTGHFQCGVTCPPPPPPTPVGCTQGAACMPGEGCGTVPGTVPGGCETACTCNARGYFDCSTDCQDAGPTPDPCPNTFVPDVCQVCSNGTTECAHAILVKGQCEIEICPGG